MNRLLLLIALFLATPLMAQAVDIYQVKDITVTVANTDPAKARDKAMTEAEKQAFDELQKRLLAGGYITDKSPISTAQISAAVDSIDIVSEKISKDYRATYSVVFSKVEISRIFAIQQIEPTVDPEKYLVIPMVLENSKLKIWKNEWLSDWQNNKREDIILPLGDLQDVQNLKEEDITARKYEGALNVEKRYGANNIVLIKAEYLKDKKALSVQLEKVKERERIAVTYEYPGTAVTSLSDLYEAAANDLMDRLEQRKLTDGGPITDQNTGMDHATPRISTAPKVPEPYSPYAPGTGYVGEKKPPYQPLAPTPPVTAPAVGLPQEKPRTEITVVTPDLIAWNRVRTKLIATPGISDLKIRSFVGGKANISINKNDDMSALTSSLSTQGLELSGAEGSWQIKEKQ